MLQAVGAVTRFRDHFRDECRGELCVERREERAWKGWMGGVYWSRVGCWGLLVA